jgi:hypothetical protein
MLFFAMFVVVFVCAVARRWLAGAQQHGARRRCRPIRRCAANPPTTLLDIVAHSYSDVI